ncbi:MAG: threonine ammonia-lyase, biosynthetic [Nannocystaceae bacterium]
MSRSYLERILNARVYDVARETPLDLAPRLSARLGNEVWLKREDLQPVFSFKVRGAFNKMSKLSPEQARRGVIAASAGNHAQGVAFAARYLGISAQLVMPRTTPPIKVEAVRAYGAEVVLHGDTYDEAAALAAKLQSELGLVFVHPYDDPDVIAGQGTVAVEILRQHPDEINAILVPVGGGGLISGISAYVSALRPQTRIIGVEPEDAASLYQALAEGRRVELDRVGIFADGVSVRRVGAEPFRIVQGRVCEVLRVSTDEICAAILDIFEDTRVVAEPAGALALAGLKKLIERDRPSSGKFVAVVSGANISFHRLRHISERAELGEGREVIFGATIPERPGAFREFCNAIGDHSVTEFNYRYAGPGDAHVFVGLELDQAGSDRRVLLDRLGTRGYACVDMSDNELAKLHARHLVGGQANGLVRERLFRFEFPERPGALREFLGRMRPGWNISLFHYRNHGAAVGRVLIGIQVPDGSDAEFDGFLRSLGLAFQEETGNAAYRMFFGA